MEQWDITCSRYGKFILTEQKQTVTGNIKCIIGSYEDGFYNGIEDRFYCRKCADKLGLGVI